MRFDDLEKLMIALTVVTILVSVGAIVMLGASNH